MPAWWRHSAGLAAAWCCRCGIACEAVAKPNMSTVCLLLVLQVVEQHPEMPGADVAAMYSALLAFSGTGGQGAWRGMGECNAGCLHRGRGGKLSPLGAFGVASLCLVFCLPAPPQGGAHAVSTVASAALVQCTPINWNTSTECWRRATM